jgi:hypothetical protein
VDHFSDAGRLAHHLVVDAGQLDDERRDRLAGVDQRRPFGLHPVAPVVEFDGSYLDDTVFAGVKTGGLDVEGDDGIHGVDYTSGRSVISHQ